jgi:glyoxylase-like metal-dependent hydrolase (beta-lactamase superfamily II)
MLLHSDQGGDTMHNAFRTVMVAAALTLSGAAAAQAPDPIIKTEGLRQISPHVHVIPDNSVPMVPNVGYVIGTTGILVIDTGMGARNGATVAEVAKKLGGSRTMYLVTTHFHPEHDLGAEAFPADTKMLRSRDQEQDIAEFGLQLAQVFASRSAINAELLKGANFRKADITFDKEHVLDLGGVQVRILAMGANHTRGDTAVWVEADRVLFSGDIAMKAQPAFASPLSRIDHWLASLDRFDALKPTVVVPSHGPNGDGGFMAGYRAYLTAIREKVTAAKRGGQSADQTVEAVTNDMASQYPDRGRLGGAVRSAYGSAP